jgi:hypothetical protein
MRTTLVTLEFARIAAAAGFSPAPDGKLNLPATQDAAFALGRAAVELLPAWRPGEPAPDVILTGPGPVWGYLVIAHALHGRAVRVKYAAPNAEIVVYSHGLHD